MILSVMNNIITWLSYEMQLMFSNISGKIYRVFLKIWKIWTKYKCEITKNTNLKISWNQNIFYKSDNIKKKTIICSSKKIVID